MIAENNLLFKLQNKWDEVEHTCVSFSIHLLIYLFICFVISSLWSSEGDW